MNKDFIKGVSISCALAVVAGSTLVFAEPYVLEAGAGGVMGQGLPIATDIGRIDSFGTAMTSGYRPDSQEFGWLSSDVNTGGHQYMVYKTGEGHYDWEWNRIAIATRPKEAGSEGQWSQDGYWIYYAGEWEFAVNNNTVWDK